MDKARKDALFLELFRENRGVARGIIARQLHRSAPHDIEDVMQTLVLKCFRAFNPERAETFKSWMLQIANRCAIDHLRRLKTRERRVGTASSLEDIEPELASPANVDPAVSMDRDRFQHAFLHVIAQLCPKNVAEVFRLHYLEGMKCVEINRKLGKGKAYASLSLHRYGPEVFATLRRRLS